MSNPETQPPLAGRPSSVLAGIPAPTLAQQVAQLEYQRDQLNQLLGELIATCLVNLHSGSIKCDDSAFRQYVEVRSNLRKQLMGDVVALSADRPRISDAGGRTMNTPSVTDGSPGAPGSAPSVADLDCCECCGRVTGCECCETCGAETHAECECCHRCHGSGQCALLSGIEWDYCGPDYWTCPSCGGTGRR